MPLRKGRLLAPSGSGGRTGVPVPGSAGAARDPGMVLPVPSASVDSGKAGSAVSSPTVASQSIEAAAPAAGLLDGEAASSPAAAEAGEAAAEAAAAPPKPAPSPLDLLSGLDFSFDAPAAPAAPAAAPGPANPFANPFADVPAAPAAPAPAPAVGSSNPFGDAPAAAPATAAPAPAAFGSGFDWPAAAAPAPAPAAQPGWHQPQAPQYGVQQPQVQAPQQGFYGAVASDDPFAGFGAPSPAAAPTYGAPPAYGAAPAYGAVPAAPYGQAPRTAAPATGSFWGSPASPSGGEWEEQASTCACGWPGCHVLCLWICAGRLLVCAAWQDTAMPAVASSLPLLTPTPPLSPARRHAHPGAAVSRRCCCGDVTCGAAGPVCRADGAAAQEQPGVHRWVRGGWVAGREQAWSGLPAGLA